MATDPVCGMQIKETNAAGKSDYKGKTYYFCSTHCKESFDNHPEKYASNEDSGHQHHH